MSKRSSGKRLRPGVRYLPPEADSPQPTTPAPPRSAPSPVVEQDDEGEQGFGLGALTYENSDDLRGVWARRGGGVGQKECRSLADLVQDDDLPSLPALREGRGGRARRYDPRHDFYPLDAPGMPVPGPDFLRCAQAMGDDTEVTKVGKDYVCKPGGLLSQLYCAALRSGGSYYLPVQARPGVTKSMAIVTGHQWGSDEVTGPVPSEVMVLGKMLGEAEQQGGRNLVGPPGDLLRECLEELGVDYSGWYVTNLMKTGHPRAEEGKSDVNKSMLSNWLPLLHQEFRIARPKYLLCLGSDAIKAVFGKKATVKGMQGRVEELLIPVTREKGEAVQYHRILVMACPHPAAAIRDPASQDELENSLSRFVQLTYGNRPDREEEGLDHRVVTSSKELWEVEREIRETCEKNLIACDAEWHKQHPQNAGAYMRTIQLSWGFKKAVCICLRSPGGEWCFDGTMKQVAAAVKRVCKGRRLAGHFFNADLEWLVHAGVDLRPEFDVGDDWVTTMRNATRDDCPVGGFDTGIAAHACDEQADFSLTSQTLRHTSAPRYDVDLIRWRDAYCSEHGLKKEEMEGYGDCPDDVLVPYACYDADVTWRLADHYTRKLALDSHGNCCWEPFWTTMYSLPAALEITRTGISIDRRRLTELTDEYMLARTRLGQELRELAKWPDFNFNSVYQVREFLFGEEFNGKQTDPSQPAIRLRPPGAVSLRLTPFMTTGKRPQVWSEVVEKGEESDNTPSTDKASLAVIAQESQEITRFSKKRNKWVTVDLSKPVNLLRDYRFISQVLRSSLREPRQADDDQFVRDDDGNYEYDAGLPAAICADGRVRTFVYPTKETGRWSTARPPLQNFSKTREKDYKRILGDRYHHPLRSILCAPPGYKLVEADYTGAELFAMAVLANDATMVDHAMRNQLSEEDPNFYDIHSHIAVLAFKLSCPPTKSGLGEAGVSHLRNVAKTVIFGVCYGRGAKAIALAVKEQKIQITVAEAQAVIDMVFQMYPGLVTLFEACRARSQDPGWLCNSFGRFRRFRRARDKQTIGDQERESMNFPIQGMIADAVALASGKMYRYRRDHPEVDYRIALQVHDALIALVPDEHVPEVVGTVFPQCMVRDVPIVPCGLDGEPHEIEKPYYLGIDVEVFQSWGEKLSPEELKEQGIVLAA